METNGNTSENNNDQNDMKMETEGNSEEENSPADTVKISAAVSDEKVESERSEPDDQIEQKPGLSETETEPAVNRDDDENEDENKKEEVVEKKTTTPPPTKRMKSSPEHRERLLAQLARGRETARKNRESGTFSLPLRNIKRIMRLNEDVGMVQNEAAILVQAAAEMFTKQFAMESLETAKTNGRKNTIKYEDLAEARSASDRLSFLEPLLP